MNTLSQWAAAASWFHEFTKDRSGPSMAVHDAPALLAAITGETVPAVGLTERYSSRIPAIPKANSSLRDELPIDVLFGMYDPKTLQVTLFVESIRRHSKQFGVEPYELMEVVRLHEYAHALVHLGEWSAVPQPCHETLDAAGLTDWTPFLSSRTASFLALGEDEHEFLAQSLTYAALKSSGSARLLQVFSLLEDKQPEEYWVSDDIKELLPRTDWSALLRVARDQTSLGHLEPGHSLRAHLEALVRFRGGEVSVSLEQSPAVLELRSSLVEVDQASTAGSDEIQLLVDRLGALKVEVFAREHPPPHFRVKVGNEAACFRIRDCAKLNGRLGRYESRIRDWHADHKSDLIAAWDRMRPEGCSVGPYRED